MGERQPGCQARLLESNSRHHVITSSSHQVVAVVRPFDCRLTRLALFIEFMVSSKPRTCSSLSNCSSWARCEYQRRIYQPAARAASDAPTTMAPRFVSIFGFLLVSRADRSGRRKARGVACREGIFGRHIDHSILAVAIQADPASKFWVLDQFFRCPGRGENSNHRPCNN
jgi:hypothetical protein